jgi:hypothetical protein
MGLVNTLLTESEIMSLSKDRTLLFHYSNPRSIGKILTSNTLQVGIFHMGIKGGFNPEQVKKYGTKGISLTRSQHSQSWGGSSIQACLILDASKLRRRYPVIPVSSKDDPKRSPQMYYGGSGGVDAHMEEVVPKDVKNIRGYILGVGFDVSSPSERLLGEFKQLIDACTQYNLPMFYMIPASKSKKQVLRYYSTDGGELLSMLNQPSQILPSKGREDYKPEYPRNPFRD